MMIKRPSLLHSIITALDLSTINPVILDSLLQKKAGVMSEDSKTSSIETEWNWEAKGKEIQLEKICFQINPVATVSCTSKSNMIISLKHRGKVVELNVGKTACPVTYFDKIKSKRPDGSLVLHTGSKKASPKTEIIDTVHKLNWSLPRISASGRETKNVIQNTAELQQLVTDHDKLDSKLDQYRTVIGRNVLTTNESLREKPAKVTRRSVTKCNVPSATIPRRVESRYKLKVRIHPNALDRRIASMPPEELLIVLCSTSSTSECIAAEKMMASVTLGDNVSIVLADCSSSSVIGKRYNFSVYPMCLMYYGYPPGSLAFISNTYNGFGTTADDFKAQIKITQRQCAAGVFKPAGFKFP